MTLPTATATTDTGASTQPDAQAADVRATEADIEAQRAVLEISLASATELCRLGLGTMVDIRQNFEILLKGAIPGTVNVPLFDVKKMLGHPLTADEQEALDCDEPADLDVKGFFTTFNQLHHVRDHILLFVCNSGRRSLYAAHLMRGMGYPKALSVGGGFQAWKKLQGVAP
jgi:rhodanese-related sulfurtransferase